MARASSDAACALVEATPEGLTAVEAEVRLKRYGPNKIARDQRQTILAELWGKAWTPLNGLLLTLAVMSWLLAQDIRSAVVIAVMVVLSVGLSFLQEHRSSAAAAKLANMVKIHATARRRDAPGVSAEGYVEVPLDELVPGDVVKLAAGDMVHLRFGAAASKLRSSTLTLPAELRRLGKEKRLIVAAHLPKTNPDTVLIKAIVRAHHWFEMLRSRSIESIADIARAEGLPRTYVGSVIPFAFLAPDITAAVLDGTQPVDLNLDRLMNARLPLDWAGQRSVLGFK